MVLTPIGGAAYNTQYNVYVSKDNERVALPYTYKTSNNTYSIEFARTDFMLGSQPIIFEGTTVIKTTSQSSFLTAVFTVDFITSDTITKIYVDINVGRGVATYSSLDNLSIGFRDVPPDFNTTLSKNSTNIEWYDIIGRYNKVNWIITAYSGTAPTTLSNTFDVTPPATNNAQLNSITYSNLGLVYENTYTISFQYLNIDALGTATSTGSFGYYTPPSQFPTANITIDASGLLFSWTEDSIFTSIVITSASEFSSPPTLTLTPSKTTYTAASQTNSLSIPFANLKNNIAYVLTFKYINNKKPNGSDDNTGAIRTITTNTYWVKPLQFPTPSRSSSSAGIVFRWNDNSYFSNIKVSATGTFVGTPTFTPQTMSLSSGILPVTTKNSLTIPSASLTKDAQYIFTFQYENNKQIDGTSANVGTAQTLAPFTYSFSNTQDITSQYTFVITASASKTLRLFPVSDVAGAVIYIKDKSGNADTNNIIIRPYEDGINIDYSPIYKIDSSYGYVALTSDGSKWWILSDSAQYSRLTKSATVSETFTQPFTKTSSGTTQISIVDCSNSAGPSGFNYLVNLPNPANFTSYLTIIGARLASGKSLYIKSPSGNIDGSNYVILTSAAFYKPTNNVSLTLFSDSQNWYIIDGIYGANQGCYDFGAAGNVIHKTKEYEKQISYFAALPNNANYAPCNILLKVPLPNNSATVLYFKNTTQSANILDINFIPQQPHTFNEYTNCYINTLSNSGVIIAAITDNSTPPKTTYYLIGGQIMP